MTEHFSINVKYFSKYPDVAAFLIVMSIALLVAWGARKSSTISNIFTALNLFTICTVIVSGIFLSDLKNWSLTSVPKDAGVGGFMPFGWKGVITGAARCFYGFIGFDSLASTGEETKNPKTTIPLAIVLSLFFATLAYSGVSSVLTLMAPYYLLDKDAPFTVIYEEMGLSVLKYMVTGGAVFALITTLIGTLFPIPRYLYAMSSDGLLFNFFSKINEKTKTPFRASIVCGLFAGMLSAFFDLDQLVQMTAIGTLQSYTIVCICVLLLRYKDNSLPSHGMQNNVGTYNIAKRFNWMDANTTNPKTQFVARILIFVYCVTSLVFCFCEQRWTDDGGFVQVALRVITFVSAAILLIIMLLFSRLPQATEQLSFKTPMVPFVPCMGIVLNTYLMVALEYMTWLRFIIWLIIGLFVYAFYGIHHSVEGKRREAYTNTGFKHEIEVSE